ncbi:MAG: DUF1987 domain-containing protein [Bacteroidota bacterium]
MEKLIIDSTPNTPSVILDPEKNLFQFTGESRPENVRNFYIPVLEWLENYTAEVVSQDKENKNRAREFHFNFEYFNSTSAKYILDLFKTLNNLNAEGINIEVYWHYEEDDEDMLEVGQEMSRMSRLTFEYIMTEV